MYIIGITVPFGTLPELRIQMTIICCALYFIVDFEIYSCMRVNLSGHYTAPSAATKIIIRLRIMILQNGGMISIAREEIDVTGSRGHLSWDLSGPCRLNIE